jgi:hypothetical protein
VGKFHQGLGEELSLYVRHCAWLNATPEKEAQSRFLRMKADGIEPEMPEISAEYLIGYLWEVGPTVPGPSGEVRITNTELRHWQENSGITLQPWECRILRRLSSDYVNECYAAAKPEAKPPFGELYRSPKLSEKLDAFLD